MDENYEKPGYIRRIMATLGEDQESNGSPVVDDAWVEKTYHRFHQPSLVGEDSHEPKAYSVEKAFLPVTGESRGWAYRLVKKMLGKNRT
jgi:hypothetical protein